MKKAKVRYGFIIMLFILFEPAYLAQIENVDTLFSFGKIVIFFVGIYGLYKRRNITKIGVIIFLFCVCLNVSTFINGGNIKESIGFFVSSMTVVLLVEMMCFMDLDGFLASSLFLFELLIYTNLVSVIIAPRGLYRIIQESGWWTNACWFLGLRNGMTPFYVIGAFLELINVYANKKSISAQRRCALYFITSTITIIMINSNLTSISRTQTAGGLLLIWILTLGYFPIGIILAKTNFWDFKKGVLLNFVFAILLTVFGIQKYFSFIISKLLNKDLTMAARAKLWENAISLIKEKIFIGYGCEYGIVMSGRLNDIAAVSTTQNGWIDILYKGGILLFFTFILLILMIVNFLAKRQLSAENTFCIGYFTTVYLFAGQSEALVGARFFFFIMIICAFSEKFALKSNNNKAEEESAKSVFEG